MLNEMRIRFNKALQQNLFYLGYYIYDEIV